MSEGLSVLPEKLNILLHPIEEEKASILMSPAEKEFHALAKRYPNTGVTQDVQNHIDGFRTENLLNEGAQLDIESYLSERSYQSLSYKVDLESRNGEMFSPHFGTPIKELYLREMNDDIFNYRKYAEVEAIDKIEGRMRSDDEDFYWVMFSPPTVLNGRQQSDTALIELGCRTGDKLTGRRMIVKFENGEDVDMNFHRMKEIVRTLDPGNRSIADATNELDLISNPIFFDSSKLVGVTDTENYGNGVLGIDKLAPLDGVVEKIDALLAGTSPNQLSYYLGGFENNHLNKENFDEVILKLNPLIQKYLASCEYAAWKPHLSGVSQVLYNTIVNRFDELWENRDVLGNYNSDVIGSEILADKPVHIPTDCARVESTMDRYVQDLGRSLGKELELVICPSCGNKWIVNVKDPKDPEYGFKKSCMCGKNMSC